MEEPVDGNKNIGFIGIGSMGFPIAETILKAGYQVTAYDKRDEALESFSQIGGNVASDPMTLARDCDNVHLVVVNDDQANNVVYGEKGLFSAFEEKDSDNHLVIHSTILPRTVRCFSEDAPDNVSVMDAAVSGGAVRARDGDLTLMVGGENSIVENYRPILETISRNVHHLGPVGSGLAVKLANNLILHAAQAGTLEAFRLGEEYGVSREEMLDVFKESSGDNWFVQNFDFITGEYLETHPAGYQGISRNSRKNLYQAVLTAKDVNASLPVAGLISQTLPPMLEDLARNVSENPP